MSLCLGSQHVYVIHASRAVLCSALNVRPTYTPSDTFSTVSQNTLAFKCMDTPVDFLPPALRLQHKVHNRCTLKGRKPRGGF